MTCPAGQSQLSHPAAKTGLFLHKEGEDHARRTRPQQTSLLISLCSGTDCMGNSIAGDLFRLIAFRGHRVADFTDIVILVALRFGQNRGRGGAQ
jgi:hypothetical protein